MHSFGQSNIHGVFSDDFYLSRIHSDALSDVEESRSNSHRVDLTFSKSAKKNDSVLALISSAASDNIVRTAFSPSTQKCSSA
jgi:hypothetical protein